MHYRIRQRWVIMGVAIVLLFAGGIGYLCFSKPDFKGYREVLERTNPSQLKDYDQSYHASQFREGVQKNFWYTRGNERLQALIKSQTAELIYENRGGGREIVEELIAVQCWVQDELTVEGGVPLQTIRYFEADHASYSLTHGILTADVVTMKSYALPGHALTPSFANAVSMMTGTADLLEMSFVDQKLTVEANGFHGVSELFSVNAQHVLFDGTAVNLQGTVEIDQKGVFHATCGEAKFFSDHSCTLQDQVNVNFSEFGNLTTDDQLFLRQGEAGEGLLVKATGQTVFLCEEIAKKQDFLLISHGEITLDHARKKLQMKSPVGEDGSVPREKQLFYQDDIGKIFANEANFSYDFNQGKVKAHDVILTGEVRMVYREKPLVQYALADRVTLFPKSDEMHFVANKGKRVLYYDRANHLQMSAPEIRMRRDEKASVKGIGDVRFVFAEKEFEEIRQQFLLDKKS